MTGDVDYMHLMWRNEVAHAFSDASLVAEPTAAQIGPRLADRDTLRRLTERSSRDGLNNLARIAALDVMDPEREAVGLPIMRYDDDAIAPGHLRALWVLPLLNATTAEFYDVPEAAFSILSGTSRHSLLGTM